MIILSYWGTISVSVLVTNKMNYIYRFRDHYWSLNFPLLLGGFFAPQPIYILLPQMSSFEMVNLRVAWRRVIWLVKQISLFGELWRSVTKPQQGRRNLGGCSWSNTTQKVLSKIIRASFHPLSVYTSGLIEPFCSGKMRYLGTRRGGHLSTAMTFVSRNPARSVMGAVVFE